MDRLTSMRVFSAAVDEGSLAAAARRLDLSPAMAGRYLDSLEQELQVRLLQRTTRRLHLTEAGQLYYQRCRRILEELDEAQREVGEIGSGPRGTLRMAAPVSFGSMYLGGPVARYMQAHPNVRVVMDLDDRYLDLVQKGIDLAIRIGRLADSSLIARRLAPCHMVACASLEYLARHGTPRTPEDLAGHRRLAFSESESPGDWTFIDAQGLHRPVAGPAHLVSNNVQLLTAAALAGAGVVYGPTFVFGEHLDKGAVRRLLPDFTTTDLGVHAVYLSTRHLPSKVRLLIDQLAKEFGDDPPWDAWMAGAAA